MKIAKLCLAAAIGTAAAMGAAQATPLTETFTFSGNGFMPVGGPLSTLTGSFTLTFDPTLSYSSFTTAGIALNSLNLPVSTIGFTYNPNANNGFLTVGGTLNGATVLPNTNDFTVLVFQVKSLSPTMGGANYSTTASSSVYGEIFQGTVSAARVPEPVTLSLFGAGLAGAFMLRRRQAKKA